MSSNVAAGLITVDELKKFNSEQLNEYLNRRLKDTNNINKHANTITVKHEVKGSNFLDLTRDDLLSIKIPPGTVKDIEKVINEIKGVQLVAASSKRVKTDQDEIDYESLNKFWQAIKKASCDKFLKLSKDTRFLGKRNGSSTLLIRKCYRDLTPVVFDTKIDKLRITGNPGIGKTYFGYYLLYLLALQDATIVYDNFNETRPIIFEGGKALVSDINDGKEPKEVNAKTILICSPRKDHYWNFAKYDGVVTVRFMPTWSLQEITKCRANDSTYQDMLDKAITGCTMDIFDYVGELDAGDKISHMLVHICVNLPAGDDDDDDNNDDDDGYDKRENISSSSGSQIQLDKNDKEAYTETIVKFASKYVRRQVTVQYEARIRERLLEKTKAGTGNPLLGIVYEYMAHKILRNGGNFDVRPLD
ncbi:hypothetical protein RhiirA1_460736 [Rhizophagus irregularis]|uniref:Crinkler family protein n=1 Tax=Rhizophagus irregularis TaxID=588596 RepID=A0A2N0RQT6_9GLOM|nr:hypothetical protein RhiirA1_460736 [Rhizophagus irregularis]